ncbi:hypothetical protein [Streptomyces cyaneofuscatus]|uniref:hypothetical protein n=1 Tax=Streptomyces cyaneofuscatus TaxID=66883 RepID=UPI00341D4AC6
MSDVAIAAAEAHSPRSLAPHPPVPCSERPLTEDSLKVIFTRVVASAPARSGAVAISS